MPFGRRPHRPAPGRVVPTATYRLQIQAGFAFADAAALADYLAALGVSHAYLSPILQSTPGSTHGYDVVDHGRVTEEAGGRAGLEALVQSLRPSGVRAVADVVPNHMAIPTPAWLNVPWWSLLREGRESPFAAWFDVDWDAEGGRVLVPVLGSPLDGVLAGGELSLDRSGGRHRDEPVLRYFDHEFPVRPGTESLELPDLVGAQAYRLCDWREGGTRLNYRRFFDITTLAGVRVEDPDVFAATHRLLLELLAEGWLDGLRIDHPDGLADPGGYLARLADATGDAWVVAEKVLEGHERLPDDWRCAGTTGYDALLRMGGVFVDASGARPLTDLTAEVVGERQALSRIVHDSKVHVVREVLAAEVNRLMRLLARIVPEHDQAGLRRALEGLLVAMDVYRAYVDPDLPAPTRSVEIVDAAVDRAQAHLPASDHESLAIVRDLALGQSEAAGDPEAVREFIVLFQQTCGPVMAKGVEDTAFYRHVRLTSLNEVGGNPDVVGTAPGDLHAFAAQLLAAWPTAMTTLSTHDTKRSEDVRARLAVLSELPSDWADWLRKARELASAHRDQLLDGATEYLLWQTVVGAWPITRERLQAYATKAVREAKLHTTWTDPNADYERAVSRFVEGVTSDVEVAAHIEGWAARTAAASRANILGQKLVQLVMPGVPDVYQGSELVDLSLVDPDNRRLVDYDVRRSRLARLDDGAAPEDLDDDKLLVTSRALRLRRERPEWFTGARSRYVPVGASSEHVLAIGRGDEHGVHVVAVATRLSERLRSAGGWRDATLALPAPGRWRDRLTDRWLDADEHGGVRLADLLDRLPVALLSRHDRVDRDEHA